MRKKIARPNSQQCGGCPEWDDINGCWDNIKNVDCCLRIGEDGYYHSDEWDDSDDIDGFEEDDDCEMEKGDCADSER
jgi:hypothetical protein